MNQEQENKPSNSSNTNANSTKESLTSNNKSNLNILNNLNKKVTTTPATTTTPNTANNGNKTSASSTSSSSTSSSNITDLPENTSTSKIKVGNDYQANLSEYDLRKIKTPRQDLEVRETPIWMPAEKLNDEQIDSYINEALSNHSYNIEQALAFLFWNKHNTTKSLNEMKKYVPKPDEWTQEEKILFEQAYAFNGKNFSKIRQILPDKSQGTLVTYYYNWKKSRIISQIENQQNNTKNFNNYDTDQIEKNGDENMDNVSDDNDSVDDNFNSNVNKICCNCDFITSDLQSTPKGQLCIPCFNYYKKTSLMRPDHVINKTLANNGSHRQNFPQNSSLLRTNRYLTISNTSQNNTMETISSTNPNNISREARNFHKSLRKPPKGIYLNYEELMDLVQVGSDKVFEELKRKKLILRKQNQINKQQIDNLYRQISNDSDTMKSEIANLLFKSESEEIVVSPFWSQKEISLALQSFIKFGDDFEAVSQIIKTKKIESIRAFYNFYKDSLNLDKMLCSNSKELNRKSNEIMSNLKKLNRTDLPVKTNGSE